MTMRIGGLVICMLFILTSCSNKFSLQKRRYTKGFYLSGAKSVTPEKHTIIFNPHSIQEETSDGVTDNEIVYADKPFSNNFKDFRRSKTK